MQFPPDTQDGVEGESMPNGRVAIGLVKNGKYVAETEVSGSYIADIAAQLLNTARLSQEQSNLTLPSGTTQTQTWANLSPSGITVGPHLQRGHALILVFGLAQLGIPLSASELKNLGEQMLTLSAESSPQ